MSTFKPRKGDLFYVKNLPIIDEVKQTTNGVGTVKAITKRFLHCGNHIFKCIATDSYVVLCEVVKSVDVPAMEGSKYTYSFDKQEFFPVGPEIKEALGLSEGVDESNPYSKEET